jgi:5-(carboxyamino)imidazole ribonucleotide synthase
MLALAGYQLGFRFRFLSSAAGPASHVAECVEGDLLDTTLLDAFAQGLDVITYEFENIPLGCVDHLDRTHRVHPPPGALRIAQDRVAEKSFLRDMGIPTAPCTTVSTRGELDLAIAQLGLPAVLKTARNGYDGRGQIVLRDDSALDNAWGAPGDRSFILEKLIPFDRELSLIAVRTEKGSTAFYPLVANVHRDGILFTSAAPAPAVTHGIAKQAQDIAAAVLSALDYVGVMAIELFQVGSDLLVNEIAPRVHNSGHWTIEGARTSQFENHLRAITGLPVGSTDVLAHSRMVNLVGETPGIAAILDVAEAHVHLYGKAPRPRRKLGHVTVTAETPDAADSAFERVLSLVGGTPVQRSLSTASSGGGVG